MALKRKNWTQEEKARLSELYAHTEPQQLAAMFGVSVNAVYQLAYGMGLKQKYTRKFTEEEDSYIREHFGKVSQHHLSRQMGINKSSIRQRAMELDVYIPTRPLVEKEPEEPKPEFKVHVRAPAKYSNPDYQRRFDEWASGARMDY